MDAIDGPKQTSNFDFFEDEDDNFYEELQNDFSRAQLLGGFTSG
jgi:hypothetical protein